MNALQKLRAWQGNVADYTLGTVIVMVQLTLADRHNRAMLSAHTDELPTRLAAPTERER